MRVPPSRRDSDSDSEATESNLAANSEPEIGLEPEPELEHDAHDEPPPQREIRSKKRNDRGVVGSNAPVIRTQQSVAQHEDEAIHTDGGSVSEATRMFDSFDTISLGRDENDNVAVEGPGVVPSEPPHKETEPIHNDQPPKSSNAAVDIPPLAEDIQNATEPEPLTVVVPLQSEQQLEPQRTIFEEPTEVEPEPNTMNIPLELEPELTLRPWLQDEAGTSAEKDPTKSADDMITGVLMSMKQDGPSTQVENEPQNEDQGQCRIPETASTSIEEKCFIWATTNNDNKYETIFQLRGPQTQEAMRYNFMTMEPSSCIDMVMVSLVCHVLNREEVERYQRDVYCVPPEILSLMFETYGSNYLDKKMKKPHLVSSLKDQEFMELLDKEKLKTLVP
ncbi:hypothetical protein PIB30_000991 [Stylosanthes scabra]|uniref:Uncharacterized protein n=1 Tax=Stylosanthes scabra TaxID=79078 RepID=A0ABU6T251_9FABA|nr:hypothetical protein [Stylosanthes scabra]